MEQLPGYISIVFIITTLISVALLIKVAKYSKIAIIGSIIWLTLQGFLGIVGFYTVTNNVPPRFTLLLAPPLVFIILNFLTKSGRAWMNGIDIKILTLFHTARIPVELTLYWLFVHKMVPQVMTFEGRNFDILCGLTAPFIYYFGYIKNSLSKNVLLAWNIVCLLLLINIVVTAILSAPFPFQKLAFNQPNIALFYFPFIWLPCCIVPIAFFAHLVTIRQLIKDRKWKKVLLTKIKSSSL